MISIKSAQEIALMRKSALLLKDVFALVGDSIVEGMSTKELDSLVYDYITRHSAVPSFLNYNGFPASICASIDEVVVHGIPSETRHFEKGQIVGIDIGLILSGFHSDCARTYEIGSVSPEKKRLVEATKQSFFEGIIGIKAGSRMGDIGSQIQTYAEGCGYGVVTALTGHGIGSQMHEDPSVPNVGIAGKGIRLMSGMTLAIEPMINMGKPQVDFLSDGWTVRTKDKKPSAHYENTVLITDTGVEIFTL